VIRPGLKTLVINSGWALAAGFLLSPLFGPLFSNQPFHRVMQRTAMITFILLFLRTAGHPRTWKAKVLDLGLRADYRWARFLIGFALAATLMALLVVVSNQLGGRPAIVHGIPKEPVAIAVLKGLAKALFTATMVSFLEEILFRGYLLKTVGSVPCALFYSVVHFITPIERTAPANGYDPLLAFKKFPLMIERFADPRIVTLGVLSLFLLGMALNTLRKRTGSLWACIGLHFGVVFLVYFYRWWLFETPNRGDLGLWIYGDKRLHDGLLGTITIALLYLGALTLPLPAFMRSAEADSSPHPPPLRSEADR
jgi:membrane protease YdiL (CAAX protease family)